MDANWKKRTSRKKKGSSTPGKTKSESCQATDLDRIYAKRSRSYKMAGYSGWCQKMNSRNGIK